MAKNKENGGLGFRNLRVFNEAMLVKQLWRLITKPNLLVSRVLKGKYFWKEQLMEVKCKNSDSWMWRTWMEAQSLKLGMRYRPSFIHVCQFPSDRDRLQKVEDLILQETKEWDVELIHKTFSPTDAAAIIKMPFSHSGQKDRIIWHWHPQGEFSVKSVYKCLMQKRSQEEPGSSHAGPLIKQMWKNTWKLPIKGKVKNFLWRCWFGFLSTGIIGIQWDCLDVHKASFKYWWFEVCSKSNDPGLKWIDCEKVRAPETVIARKAQEEWLEFSDSCRGWQKEEVEVEDSHSGVGQAHLAVSTLSNISGWLGFEGGVLREGVLIQQWSEAKQFAGTKEEGKLLAIRWILEKHWVQILKNSHAMWMTEQ
ncbi:ribonuclease H-like superfamily protein [Striga asiatica]|uniref:Ribonuclease H-like superfamily protein n=1 Tax=Striga asiatica TaxID=4170 RepID=A0A5A7QAD5_STRAF|nr:ribonuclease H-like superfamily protein [Striga asiatica]